MSRILASAVLLALLSSVVFAGGKRVPDLPARASISLQNQKQSADSTEFQKYLESSLSRPDNRGHRRRSGLQVKKTKEEAAFVLQFELKRAFGDTDCQAYTQCSSTPAYAYLDVVLTDASGGRLWSQEYSCVPTPTREPLDACAQDLGEDLKAAQVDANGKRAGWSGWTR